MGILKVLNKWSVLLTDTEAEYAGVDDKQGVTLTEGTEHGGDASDH